MDGVTINIGWEYFLGIMGSLILIAWYSNGRFMALETSMEWVKKSLDNLGKVVKKDEVAPANSPRKLNERGNKILNESGIKGFVDKKRTELTAKVREHTFTNPYDAEKYILDLMQEAPKLYPEEIENMKTGAFRTGADIDTVLLVGGFYLRDLVFPELGFSVDEITEPNIASQ